MLALVLNIPFGYLRAKEKKFSFRWWLYIHLPIPFIIFVRIASQLDFRYIPIFIFAAVIGQICGGKLGVSS